MAFKTDTGIINPFTTWDANQLATSNSKSETVLARFSKLFTRTSCWVHCTYSLASWSFISLQQMLITHTHTMHSTALCTATGWYCSGIFGSDGWCVNEPGLLGVSVAIKFCWFRTSSWYFASKSLIFSLISLANLSATGKSCLLGFLYKAYRHLVS